MSNKTKKKTKQEIELMKAKAKLLQAKGVYYTGITGILTAIGIILKYVLDFILQLLK